MASPSSRPPGADEVLEFFRFDVSRDVKKILTVGVILLTLGPPLVIVSAAATFLKSRHLEFGLTGAFLMVSGLFVSFIGIGRLLFRDEYIVARQEALEINQRSGKVVVPWETVTAIEAEVMILRVRRDRESPIEIRGGFKEERAKDIALRLSEVLRKRRFGLAT